MISLMNHFTKYNQLQAMKIIQRGLRIFGSYSNWEAVSGGSIMTSEEVSEYVTNYLESVNMLDEIKVNYKIHSSAILPQ